MGSLESEKHQIVQVLRRNQSGKLSGINEDCDSTLLSMSFWERKFPCRSHPQTQTCLLRRSKPVTPRRPSNLQCCSETGINNSVGSSTSSSNVPGAITTPSRCADRPPGCHGMAHDAILRENHRPSWADAFAGSKARDAGQLLFEVVHSGAILGQFSTRSLYARACGLSVP